MLLAIVASNLEGQNQAVDHVNRRLAHRSAYFGIGPVLQTKRHCTIFEMEGTLDAFGVMECQPSAIQ